MKLREHSFIKIEASFIDEISGLVRVKCETKGTEYINVKTQVCEKYIASLDVTNIAFEMITFNLKEMLGILDLRSIRYYKIKHGILQQNLSKYYKLKLADVLCEQFNKFVNTLKKEKEKQRISIHG